MKARTWVMNHIPAGLPSIKDFSLKEEFLPECKDGDIIIEADCFSVDPYIREVLRNSKVNETIYGSQVGRVIASKNKGYPVGSYAVGYPGWRDRTHLTKDQLSENKLLGPFTPLPDLGKYPKTTALGILGMPGFTAYFGLLEICKPKPGDTVLVSGAAGAVGSVVCQIAKIQGCTVIAFAGTPKKVQWLKDLGVDHVFNYKTISITEALKKAAPNGINCYYDNVGGDFSAEAMDFLASGARVAACGSISTYNENKSVKRRGEVILEQVLWKQIKVEGFYVTRWIDRWNEALVMLKFWMNQGCLKYQESTSRGFENLPKAFLGLFSGENFGKAVVIA